MKNIELFRRELNLIQNENLRKSVEDFMVNCVPAYFWTTGASSSGKYHPQFSQGEGGLVRHTKAVVMFAEELLRMSTYAYMKQDYKDYVIAACIMHDTFKYGFDQNEINKEEYKNHAANAANKFNEFCEESAPEFLLSAMRGHMGQWSTDKDDRPFTNIDRCVHMADYMASRSFIDIPSITADYNDTVNADDLPF